MPKLAVNGAAPVRDRAFHAWPVADRSDVEAVGQAILSGDWNHVTGSNIRAFETEFAELQDAKFGVACNGGTTALEIALRIAGVVPGDEVIVPSYTFIASALAVLNVGAVPVFCDVEEDTFNIDPASAEAAITEYTTAIMPVHFGGRAAAMGPLTATAKLRGLKIVEDACHGWGAKWRGQGLGSLGFSGGFSFQASKNLTAGEGGFVTTNDPDAADLAARIRRGYSEAEGKPVVMGNNYRMTEIQAALLRSQMRRLPEQNRVRMANAEYLTDGLSELPGIHVLRRDPDVTHSSTHVYLFRFVSEEFEGLPRSRFVEALRAEGIPAGTVYRAPLQEYQLFAGIPGTLPGGGPLGWGRYKGSADYTKMRTPVCDRLCKAEAIGLSQNVFLGPRGDMDDILEAAGKIRANVGELIATAAVR